MVPEKAKLVLLGVVLACIINSFFRSDAFGRGANAGFTIQLHEGFVCQGRKEELREECREALGKALIPTKLSCLPLFRNVFVCQNPVGGSTNERRCSKEYQEVSECLKTHLGPYGFTDEEILRLLFGKQQPAPQQKPQQKPSLDVSKEGGGDKAGQKKKPSQKGDEAGGKSDRSGGSEGDPANEAPGGGEGPKVEVEQASEKEGNRRR